jgi:hypothetical protein
LPSSSLLAIFITQKRFEESRQNFKETSKRLLTNGNFGVSLIHKEQGNGDLMIRIQGPIKERSKNGKDH